MEWKQPIGRQMIQWRNLTVGDDIDLRATFYKLEDEHLQAYDAYRRRVVAVGGKAAPLELQALGEWDSVDLRRFSDHVDGEEEKLKKEWASKCAPPVVEGKSVSWTLPTGEPLRWQALQVKDELDVLGSFRAPHNKHLADYELVRRRLVSFGKEGKPCDMPTLRGINSIAFDLLTDEIAKWDKSRAEAFTDGPLVTS